MKQVFSYGIIFLTFLISACSSDEGMPGEKPPTVAPCDVAGPPAFVGTPKGFYGKSSINIQVQTDMPATIYYIISDSEISEKEPDNVKQTALSNSNVISAGFIAVDCDAISNISSIIIDNLPEETKLYAYLVAESYVSDTTLQPEVSDFQFTTNTRLETETFTSSVKSREALYVRYVPDEEGYIYPEKEIHPLIIFLGGNGEVAPPGEINVIQNGSIPKYISEGNDIPFIVIAPEHTVEEWDVEFIHEVVEYAIENYAVDPNRVIITGMSGGGIGTLNYAMAYPEVPAVIVPVSGEGETAQACLLTDMAVWAFHNQEDPKVPASGSIDMINTLKSCSPGPAKEVNLTVFEDEGHNAWIRVYNPESVMWELDTSVEPINIYDWMLEQAK